MKITDEHLSAFLDAALPEADMEAIRHQLMLDETLSDRLAELAMVDVQVRRYSEQIDKVPLPESVLQLLTPQTSAKVVPLALWRRAAPQFRHAAAVAGIALLAGYGANQILSGTADNFATVAQILDGRPSGRSWSADEETEVQPRLSFFDEQGDLCRQYLLVRDHQSSENIACRRQGEWQVQISMATGQVQEAEYVTASGGSVLDEVLDKLMQGPALTAKEEAQLFTPAKHN
jgi:hypothetical protein